MEFFIHSNAAWILDHDKYDHRIIEFIKYLRWDQLVFIYVWNDFGLLWLTSDIRDIHPPVFRRIPHILICVVYGPFDPLRGGGFYPVWLESKQYVQFHTIFLAGGCADRGDNSDLCIFFDISLLPVPALDEQCWDHCVWNLVF
ncbi:MAG: hypothetical protein IJ713_06130 [Oscillibacter sp.]|nr:hypothetical protein [Oscillibacter sp.]